MEEKIIKAVIHLFEKEGIKFTLDDLAEQEAISKKTIYKFFDNKEQLVERTVDYVFDDIARQHVVIISTDKPLLEKLREVLLVYPTVFQVTEQSMKKIIQFYPSIYQQILAHFNAQWDVTFQLLHDCIAQKIVQPISDQTFQIIMVGIFDNVIRYPEQKKVLSECVEVVLRGIIEEKYRSFALEDAL